MKTLKDGGGSARNSNCDLRSISNRGSTTSLRMHRIKEDYNIDDDEQTSAMLLSTPVNSNGIVTSRTLVDGIDMKTNKITTNADVSGPSGVSGRRTQSAMNLSSSSSIDNIPNSGQTNRFSVQDGSVSSGASAILNHHSVGSTHSLVAGTITKINKADINANGMMELKQFGNKKSVRITSKLRRKNDYYLEAYYYSVQILLSYFFSVFHIRTYIFIFDHYHIVSDDHLVCMPNVTQHQAHIVHDGLLFYFVMVHGITSIEGLINYLFYFSDFTYIYSECQLI